MGFPGGSVEMNVPANEDVGLIPGPESPPGEERQRLLPGVSFHHIGETPSVLLMLDFSR